MQTYEVEITLSTQEDGLWRVEVPALPGCFVDEETVEEALDHIQDGIRMFIASYRKAGDPVPPDLKLIEPKTTPKLKLLVSIP